MSLHVLATGPLVTVQDRGRLGLAHLGVPRAGALDVPAAELANRLVGNAADAAVLEVLLGGLSLRADAGCWVAVTGAPVPLDIAGSARAHARAHARAEWLATGETLTLGTPTSGLRSYVAVSGGVDVPPVLGSRSTDTLAWVGPPRVESGTVLPVGRPRGAPRPLDTPRAPRRGALRVTAGPRADWFDDDALDRLCATPYVVSADSDRIGLRLDGPALPRRRTDEPVSEGMVLGAVQVPPSGVPVVFLADHPPTGGYPVLALVDEADLWQCAQLRPGEDLRFTRRRGSPAATP
ncbi:biotin-dependent carboxyltransferase family protein [Nocardioides sp. YIM 152315]|uniref:5-oxoprolinase subunit C family protein n=1 Tax=Nocardioides sp. YIM 152315 TaxID=3031760 RepID=UPI0023DCDE1C|nr:biotin-dependent carboxyltransferase family protein [Nocardioides sp. YIM 152315]MDF1603158.1 biotin-dependent carboxyltransferase family protein [Nocardioides sp. YIM 152315]